MSLPSGYNPLPIFMVQSRICRLRCSPRDARRVRLSQGIRRLCGELMLLQKAVLLARGLKPNPFDKRSVSYRVNGGKTIALTSKYEPGRLSPYKPH